MPPVFSGTPVGPKGEQPLIAHFLAGCTKPIRYQLMAMSNGNTQWVTGAISRQSRGGGWAPGTRREDSRPEGNSALWRIIKRLDVYAKIDDDLQVKTETGAAVTIGFWMLMIVLVVGEIQAYRRVQPPIEHVVVDSTMGQRVRINADIVSARHAFLYSCENYCQL